MSEQPNPEGRPGPDAAAAHGIAGGATSGPVAQPHGHLLPFGGQLAPVLLEQCGGRLNDIHWFRTDWQRGGALTGYAQWTCDDGRIAPVVVKLPVPPRERWWLTQLQAFPDVVPILYAHGDSLGQYDIVWVIMERLPHGPLGHAWQGREFDLFVDVVGRFYAAAENLSRDKGRRHDKDWEAIFHRSREFVHRHSVPHEQRWNTALKRAHRKLPDWLAMWNDRPADHWCHGDLHLANAMTRVPAPGGPALLLDFAETHLGHWVEDAVYFEHLFWARRDRLEGRKLCSMIAKARRAAGLHECAEWPKWADIKRALLAMSTPAMLEHDGDPHHVEAALEVLERVVH